MQIVAGARIQTLLFILASHPAVYSLSCPYHFIFWLSFLPLSSSLCSTDRLKKLFLPDFLPVHHHVTSWITLTTIKLGTCNLSDFEIWYILLLKCFLQCCTILKTQQKKYFSYTVERMENIGPISTSLQAMMTHCTKSCLISFYEITPVSGFQGSLLTPSGQLTKNNCIDTMPPSPVGVFLACTHLLTNVWLLFRAFFILWLLNSFSRFFLSCCCHLYEALFLFGEFIVKTFLMDKAANSKLTRSGGRSASSYMF